GEVRTLCTVMKELGHQRIDLLKMDIEGAEYAVLENMLATGVRPRIVCVELEHPSPVRNVRTVLALRRAGYDVCRVDGRNITLVLRQL
ncbi:MAG TPA: FkbM family methyltransferase, partial [Anaeromyxobacter sp.]